MFRKLVLLVSILFAAGSSTSAYCQSNENRMSMESVKFESVKKTWTRILKAAGPVDVVFPLLCPVKEYDWIPTWKCKMVQSESGIAEDLCVFRTSFSDQELGEVWVCTRYEPNSRIEYTRFLPSRITRLRIILQESKSSSSDWVWEISMIGLNDEGNSYVDEYEKTGQFFKSYEGLENLLNYYLINGKMID